MNSPYQTLKTELKDNGILTIILNRSESLNALSQPLLEELAKVLEEAKYLPQIKALLITGEGKAFCAGADINQLAGLSAEEGLVFAKRGQSVFWALETLGKPSLAAINGFAFGGGCELAMSATMRIAGKPAKFGQPEVKLGVIPGFGGTQRLARLAGKGRALDLCLTGRFINSDEALAWGLVSEVTEPENLLARAETILLGILDQGPLAVRAVMEVIQTGYDLNLADALHLEAVQFALTCASDDKNEGVQAFLGKRKAVFTGK